MDQMEMKYLKSLAEIYPTIAKASTEIINLQSILSLPKGTEHFLSDVHGEYEAFSHVLKNGSGSIRRKIDDIFGHTMSQKEKRALATLIYYPAEKLKLESKKQADMEEWYRITLYRLIEVCKRVASKYTRSKVRKALPQDFAYVIEELITEKADISDKEAYYEQIITAIIEVGRADKFIVALGELIQRMIIDHLHILGDIYDRGPSPDKIIDKLMEYHAVDIQWGNHDVLWMGAATGQRVCVATVVRICARYANLDILEDGYGINLLPLATFSLSCYKEDPCSCFQIKGDNILNPVETELNMKMHKAVSIIAFKLEGQLLREHPEFAMAGRMLLDKINYEEGTIDLEGKTYQLLDKNFPTIDPADPYRLSEEEQNVCDRLCAAFAGCEKLQRHMTFLLNKGGLYRVYNGNLLYHGCIPLQEDGSFKEVEIAGKACHGKELYDVLDSYVRKAFVAADVTERETGKDMLWYIWSSADSPLFGKDKMATFERYFLEDKATHVEKKNPYYLLQDNEEVLDHILKEFHLEGECRHIINGHVPVHHTSGESPVKGGGKLLVIDGGLSKAYQKETGIAGYTLIYNSWGLILAAHQPFTSAEDAIAEETDILSDSILVKKTDQRKSVGDTDNGKYIQERIIDLQKLLQAFRSGLIIEK
ncbi:MAG: fructose-1,6-bisphosphatase [Lachnospiraceae bacterium]|nr:fructose-1,6-bisphosphatase [Lachnospiraceae bacterium]